MTVSSDSYGTSNQVAGYVPRFAEISGDFSTTTNPTKARVEGMIDRISSIINSYLAAMGFTVPLTTTAGINAMTELVIEYTAELVEGINGSSRFAPGSKALGNRNRWTVITDEINKYLEAAAIGFVNMGETRSSDTLGEIGYRGTDNDGRTIFPIFQRRQFGEQPINWDPKSGDVSGA